MVVRVRNVCLAVCLAGLSLLVRAESDPTAPLGWQAPATQKKTAQRRLPELQGIVCPQQETCSVILDNRVVQPGEQISGYTLKSVQDDAVILQRGGRQWRLALFHEQIKIHE
ncbi:MSHA biogenesis protein MshK [Photobacterium galatheae]|nr:MSHA biogenesis protein MshK [Photobacterium galatheae]